MPQLLSQVSLQAHKKRGKSRSDIHSLAKIYIKSKKLQDARSKKEVVDILTEIQEDDLNKGLTDEANTITSRITEIEEAAVPMTKALMFSDADMSKAISREKKEEEDKSRALRGLELLGEDSSD